MPMYNLIEYSDNYSDTSGSLWQFKRDEVATNDADLTIDNFAAGAAGGNSFVKNTKIVAHSIKVFKNLLGIIKNDII